MPAASNSKSAFDAVALITLSAKFISSIETEVRLLNVKLPLVVEIVLPLMLMLSVCKLVNVPKLVMFGCAAVVKVPATFVALMLPFTTTVPVPLGDRTKSSFVRVAEILLSFIVMPSKAVEPLTAKDESVPTDVMFV